jgi:APA family basic amino acid/polyamine antiporter
MSEFKKSLNLFDATAIVVGSMIGSGIFIVSADISRLLGSPGYLLLVWIVTGLMTIFAAVSFGELAAMMPSAGGHYIYLKEAYKPITGFLYGWTLFTVIQTGTIAAVAMAFAKFSGVIYPWISASNMIFSLGPIAFHTQHLVAIASIVLLTWINTRGISESKFVQNVFTWSKIIILIAFVAVGLIYAKGHIYSSGFWQATTKVNGTIIPLTGLALIAAFGSSMVGSLFSVDAWYGVAYASAEVKNAKVNLPLSLFFGTLLVSVLYVLVNLVYIKSLPVIGTAGGANVLERGIQFAADDRVGTASMESILGHSAELIMAIVVIISTFGCNNGLIMSGPRVFYAMAKDGLFFNKLGELNKRSVPGNALVAQLGWATVLCLSGTYSNLLDYVIMAVLLFNGLTIAGIFILRIKKPGAERSYKAFGYPVIPGIFILFCVFVITILLIYKPIYTWPGLIIVLTGIPVYYFWESRKKLQKPPELEKNL